MSTPEPPQQAPATSTQQSNFPGSPPPQNQARHVGAGFPGISGVALGLQTNIWNGPYPPPEAVNVYERVEPGAFSRMLTMNEKRQEAEIEISKKSLEAAIADTKRANYMGFAVTLGALAGGFCLISLGHSAAGLAVILCYGVGAGLSFFLRKPVGIFTHNQQNKPPGQPKE